MLPLLTLVVSTLIALMKDQIDSLLDSGIPASRFDSTMSHPERNETDDRLRASPEAILCITGTAHDA
mgnify:CR=1 FL=1